MSFYSDTQESNFVTVGMPEYSKTKYTIASFRGEDHIGDLYFTLEGNELSILGKVNGLPSGRKLGVHIHEYGTIANGCNLAGPHFNPFNR
ncbi:unnamed protein product [Heterobilharzia americana]|nr:unnamed protein product [Heterobilharzia americana]